MEKESEEENLQNEKKLFPGFKKIQMKLRQEKKQWKVNLFGLCKVKKLSCFQKKKTHTFLCFSFKRIWSKSFQQQQQQLKKIFWTTKLYKEAQQWKTIADKRTRFFQFTQSNCKDNCKHKLKLDKRSHIPHLTA